MNNVKNTKNNIKDVTNNMKKGYGEYDKVKIM